MTTEKMTIHKALSELKILDSRIENALADFTACRTNKHSNAKIGGMEIEDYKKENRSMFDSAVALINRRDAIKRAVIRSNAKTVVTIAGNTFSVAEAIEFKNNGIAYQKMLLDLISRQYKSASERADEYNQRTLLQEAEQKVTTLYGSKESNVAAEAIKATREEYIRLNTLDIIDTIGCQKKIRELSEKIDSFMVDVDSALSVSNATTYIEISY